MFCHKPIVSFVTVPYQWVGGEVCFQFSFNFYLLASCFSFTLAGVTLAGMSSCRGALTLQVTFQILDKLKLSSSLFHCKTLSLSFKCISFCYVQLLYLSSFLVLTFAPSFLSNSETHYLGKTYWCLHSLPVFPACRDFTARLFCTLFVSMSQMFFLESHLRGQQTFQEHAHQTNCKNVFQRRWNQLTA